MQSSLENFSPDMAAVREDETRRERDITERLVKAREDTEKEAARVCGCGRKYYWYRPLKLHPGALYVYKVDGEWRALADIDHVYHKCREGLIGNIRELARIFEVVKQMGIKAVIVGKAYDDDLYLYARDVRRGTVMLNGLNIRVSEAPEISFFERMESYMDRVSPDILGEALGVRASSL